MTGVIDNVHTLVYHKGPLVGFVINCTHAIIRMILCL